VLVELRLGVALGHTVEVGEEVRLVVVLLPLVLLRAPYQIVDQHLGVHLLLDVQRRRVHHQVGPVLLVLAAPDECGSRSRLRRS
jgi:hypothetical protein